MSSRPAPRLRLAHLPTPIVCPRGLAELVAPGQNLDLWVKRDDATGGAEAGNKIRKLEFLLAEAVARGAKAVLTCGGIQSNHARATALLAAGLGLEAVLFLRSGQPLPHELPQGGNVLLDRLAGATIRLISPETYRDRTNVMQAAADEIAASGRVAYVIPEGGSNGVGSQGYVEAMAEVRRQLDLGLAGGKPFDLIVHACGSGGTSAGIVLGAARYGVAPDVRSYAVCDDAAYFHGVVDRIVGELQSLRTDLGSRAGLVVDDTAKGPAYAATTPEQRRSLVEVTRASGLVLDPVYTGKAFHGLRALGATGALAGKRVLFVHTGGLPGLLAQGDVLANEL